MSNAPRLTARLKPAVRVLWRSPDEVQFELDSRRIMVRPVTSGDVSTLLGGRSGVPGATVNGAADPRRQALREVLRRHGFLSDQPVDRPSMAGQFQPEVGVLGLDSAAWATMLARRGAAVAVHGTARVAAVIASALAAAGVGRVQLGPGGPVVQADDACPGGLTPRDEGRRFGAAAAEAVTRASPSTRTDPLPADARPDLVVIADPDPVDPTLRDGLHLDGVPHVVAAVQASSASIGPLVVPGLTSCLRCADLHRTERDPAWPALAVQLSTRRRSRPPTDGALCLTTAGLLVNQALRHLDGTGSALVDGTIECHLPDWRWRRRTWRPHPRCDCGAASRVGARRNPVQDGRMDT